MPVVIATVREMQRFADEHRKEGKRIGVVPTMGALHEGHLSLIRIAASSSDVVVCTIFVNPTQFGPSEDLTSYPRSLDDDVRKALSAGAAVIFAPTAEEMYPNGYQTYVVNERIAGILEGKERPGHFRGVATVVLKLFSVTKPHLAVFGQKDAQQLAVIRTMVRDLGLDVEIVAGPIVREPNGLAMSSRNIYLDEKDRQRATVLHASLERARTRVVMGERSLDRIRSGIKSDIEAVHPSAVDYIEPVHPETFESLQDLRGDGTLIVLVARFGKTRLLDNILLQTS